MKAISSLAVPVKIKEENTGRKTYLLQFFRTILKAGTLKRAMSFEGSGEDTLSLTNHNVKNSINGYR